jgi:hypothetical protein
LYLILEVPISSIVIRKEPINNSVESIVPYTAIHRRSPILMYLAVQDSAMCHSTRLVCGASPGRFLVPHASPPTPWTQVGPAAILRRPVAASPRANATGWKCGGGKVSNGSTAGTRSFRFSRGDAGAACALDVSFGRRERTAVTAPNRSRPKRASAEVAMAR